jgi:putative tryptophan/tyrosine transport system substrate-binding protein
MNRRNTVVALIALGVAPFAAWAQPVRKVFRIGLLSVYPREFSAAIVVALRELGYEEGRNIEFDYRFAEGKEDRLAGLAAELVASKIDLIIAPANPDILAAKRATSTIPIVMVRSLAPIETGLIASLSRPGGNVTGTTIQAPELAGKMVEVLRDAVPRITRVTVLWEPEFPGMELYRRESERAAGKMGIRLTLLPGRTLAEMEAGFAHVVRERPDALMVVLSGAIFTHRARVIEFATRQRLPAIYTSKLPVAEGGLISYASEPGALVRRTAAIIDRVLKGAKPADIPVEQPTKYELVINLKTAKAIGLTIPQSLLIRADEVIQ